ncbi:Ankyrin repeat domain-containing protein 39 [Gamsiella multidivaricata]|nr:Ankyrin repeat domain-containing protein 39 [Gamsiella multidivaricata]
MARPQQGCTDHGQPGHICNHSPSSIAENLDEIEFSRSIHAACISNNLTRVQTILSKGNSRGVSPANALDTAGYTALHYASRAGNKEICTLLLNAGADIDAKTPELGATPLMRAVQQNHIAIARLLVSYGASIDDHNADQENVFHIVAVAASGGMNNNNDPEVFLELVRWLRIKADSQEGRLSRMLKASNVHGRIPVECLGDVASSCPALATMLSSN